MKQNNSLLIPNKKNFIPTLNDTGYMTALLDVYSEKFINFAAKATGKNLEIGAAFGVATLEALKKEARIIANDLDKRHLAILKAQAIEKGYNLKYLETIEGNFLTDVNLAENSIENILICRVLHLFPAKDVELAISKMFSWLKPGGRLFIIADTPFLKIWSSFIPTYEEQLKKGSLWPGLITNPQQYFPDIKTPTLINTFDLNTLSRVLSNQGFIIENLEYLNRQDYPSDRRFDGRESVASIASKPKSNSIN